MERGGTAWRAAAVKHGVGGVVVVVVSAVVFVLAGRAVAQLFCVAFLLWRLVVLVVRAVRKVVEVDGVGVAWTEGVWPTGNVLFALRSCGVCEVFLERGDGRGIDDVLGEEIVDGDEGEE